MISILVDGDPVRTAASVPSGEITPARGIPGRVQASG